jgi:hypothetical protein
MRNVVRKMVAPGDRVRLLPSLYKSRQKPARRKGRLAFRTGVRHAAIARFAFLLCASDSLVLKYPDYDSSVLRLTLSRLVIADLPAFAHSPGCQHIGQGDVALLLKKLSDTVGPVLA